METQHARWGSTLWDQTLCGIIFPSPQKPVAPEAGRGNPGWPELGLESLGPGNKFRGPSVNPCMIPQGQLEFWDSCPTLGTDRGFLSGTKPRNPNSAGADQCWRGISSSVIWKLTGTWRESHGPVFTLFTLLFTRLIPAFSQFAPMFTWFTPAFTQLTSAFTKFTPAFTWFTPTFTRFTLVFTWFTPTFTRFTPVFTQFTPAFTLSTSRTRRMKSSASTSGWFTWVKFPFPFTLRGKRYFYGYSKIRPRVSLVKRDRLSTKLLQNLVANRASLFWPNFQHNWQFSTKETQFSFLNTRKSNVCPLRRLSHRMRHHILLDADKVKNRCGDGARGSHAMGTGQGL